MSETNKEKLEFKHIAPYLPFDLKAISVDDLYMWTEIDDAEILENADVEITIVAITKDFLIYDSDNINGAYCNNRDLFESFKPFLRPLSDLTKEIEHNGEKFVPYLRGNFQSEYIAWISNSVGIKEIPYSRIELLFEWHFDVFGLIEKGLAVELK